jgi:putative hemolysin
LDTLHMLFGVEVAGEPYETVGGLVFGSLGQLPEAGQRIEALGLELTVRHVEGRRIKSVVVRPIRAGAEPEP